MLHQFLDTYKYLNHMSKDKNPLRTLFLKDSVCDFLSYNNMNKLQLDKSLHILRLKQIFIIHNLVLL